jgi:hypothetical protein
MNPVLNRCQIFLAVTLAIFLGVIATANCQTEAGIIHIKFSDVPITSAIDNLARMANLNYIVDPKLFAPPGGSNPNEITAEPKLTIDGTNMTAQNALAAILKEHGLVMVQDKFTTVTFITGTNHIANVVDASLLDGNTNDAAQMTNGPVPVFRFEMVPLDVTLKNLIAYNHLNVVLDPKVSDYVDPTDYKFHNAPYVSIRWQNLTAKQAIVALCENYDLVVVKDAATGVVSIKPKD